MRLKFNFLFSRDKGESTLTNILVDLFIAGMETTSTSLLWAFLYMLHNPECQEKVFEEIQTHVGLNRLPSLSDQSAMHYTNAFLLETLRASCFVPLSVFHYTFDDIQIGSYTIPKDSAIIGSLYHVMYDSKFFPQPEIFKPERFLNQDGHFVPDEHVVPFGIGKRMCLGKALAEKEFFLFFTGILQSFEFCQAPGSPLPSYGIEDVPVMGLSRNVPSYDVVLKSRN